MMGLDCYGGKFLKEPVSINAPINDGFFDPASAGFFIMGQWATSLCFLAIIYLVIKTIIERRNL
jgi:hypothetical protein